MVKIVIMSDNARANTPVQVKNSQFYGGKNES